MKNHGRRSFLRVSTATMAAGLSSFANQKISRESFAVSDTLPAVWQSPESLPENQGKKPLRLGLIIGIGKDPAAAMAKVRQLGLPTSQIFVNEFEPDLVNRLRQ